MQVEITAAINLIAASLYNKLPRRRVDAFAEEIEKGIITKFQGHWYPDNPSKGAAYRCINVSGDKVDPVIIYAVINSGLDIEEVNSYLPKDLTIWIDPGEVSFSIGEKGQVKLLYSERHANSISDEPTTNTSTINFTSIPVTTSSTALSLPILSEDVTSGLSSTFGNLNLSAGGNSNLLTNTNWGINASPVPWPTSSTSNPWSPVSSQKTAAASPWNSTVSCYNPINNPQQAFPIGAPLRSSSSNKTMTAAMFAQTKFGSTKLKTQAKRSNRLSPTENFGRNTQGQHALSVGSRTLPSTTNQTLMDRMQLHLQQTNNNDFQIDQHKNGGLNRNERHNHLQSMQNMNNFNGGISSFSPTSLSSLNGIISSPEQEWVDLTDLAVHPTGNQLLAT